MDNKLANRRGENKKSLLLVAKRLKGREKMCCNVKIYQGEERTIVVVVNLKVHLTKLYSFSNN